MLGILGRTLEPKMCVYHLFYNGFVPIPNGLDSDVANPGSDPGSENVAFPLVLQ